MIIIYHIITKMILNLFWEDFEENSYNIATLEYKNNLYFLRINEQELKKAIKRGCMGIGNCKFLKNEYSSKSLFNFFKNRIPSKNHPEIDKILKKYNLNEYDEMKLLKITEARRNTDRYWVAECLE